MLYGSYHGLPFRVLKVEGYSKQLTFTDDRTQPVGMHVEFSGTIVLNSDTLSNIDWLNSEDPNFVPEIEGPQLDKPGGLELSAPELVYIVEQRLSVPRKQFLLWGYVNKQGGGRPDRVYLCRSPAMNDQGKVMSCDARHGPTPKVVWSYFESGQGTVILGFNIETDLPLCKPKNQSVLSNFPNGAPPGPDLGSPVIANTWTMQVGTSEDFYATHRIVGEAICRMDLMKDRKITLDMLRGWFLHPIPLGFKRETCDVFMLEGGVKYRYEIVDVEQQTDKPGISAYGAARIEVTHQREISAANPLGIL